MIFHLFVFLFMHCFERVHVEQLASKLFYHVALCEQNIIHIYNSYTMVCPPVRGDNP